MESTGAGSGNKVQAGRDFVSGTGTDVAGSGIGRSPREASGTQSMPVPALDDLEPETKHISMAAAAFHPAAARRRTGG